MELIKLISDGAATQLVAGEAIQGYDSALWVERYQTPGEFKLVAKLSSGLMEQLPIGSFITHIDTEEFMWVENHIIKEPKDKDPIIEITGRSFVCYLEQRLIAQNYVALGGTEIYQYEIPADETWEQAVFLIFDQLIDPGMDPDDIVQAMDVEHSCTGTGTVEARNIKYGSVWDRVYELLKIDDIGIRMIRPTSTDSESHFHVYQGADRTKTVRFSSLMGDLENVEYFLSFKQEKNAVRVVGRWVQIVEFSGTPIHDERRYMLIDGSDIDQQQPAMPTGTPLALIQGAMTIRAREALKRQNTVTITQADISPSSKLKYRIHYGLGDLVSVDGKFNQTQVMRVTEFAESEDENGTSGTPTLAIPGE